MKSSLFNFSTIVVIAALCTGMNLRAEEKKIAVVNVATVFSNYAKIKDIQEKLKGDYAPRQSELDSEERAIKLMMAKIGDMGQDESDKNLFQAKITLEQRKFDFQTKLKSLYIEIEERRKVEMKKVLEDIKGAINQAGRAKHVDLVLRAPEFDNDFDPTRAANQPAEDKAKTAQELVQRFRENPVLYFAEGVDITIDVTDILNANYKARGGK